MSYSVIDRYGYCPQGEHTLIIVLSLEVSNN